MKTKGILSFVLFCLAMTASAQVQLLFFDGGRHVIDRNKKLYWMDAGEEDPCFDIINYKKTGNKETFTLKCKEKERYGQPSTYSATLTVDGDKTVELLVTGKGADGIEKFAGKVKNTSGSAYEDQRLKDYFNGLAGNPVGSTEVVSTPATPAAPTSVGEAQEGGVKGTVGKMKDAAKGALGKMKGVFKKKK